MKWTKRLFRLGGLLFIIGFALTPTENRDPGVTCCAVAILLVAFGSPFTIAHDYKKEVEEERQANEEYKRELAAKIRKTQYMNANVSTTRKTSTSSAIGRAVVGGAIAGDVGAIVGASTAKQKVKNKHTTTFLVLYKDGHKSLETVADESLEYQVYVDKLEIE